MAVYHLACRIAAEPHRPNPPGRVAKWQQACALPSCRQMIWKGDAISCTRDNENGVRKGPRLVTEDHIVQAIAEVGEEESPITERMLALPVAVAEERIREIVREELSLMFSKGVAQ